MTFRELNNAKKEAAFLYKEGKTKKEIFDLLGEGTAGNEREVIAGIVNGLMPEKMKNKYLFHLYGISALFLVFIYFWMIYPYQAPGIMKIAVYAVMALWAYLVFSQLQRNNAGALNTVIAMGSGIFVILFIRGLLLANVIILISSVLLAGTIFYAYKLRKIIVPGFTWLGKVKKDENGNYIFGEGDIHS